MSTNPTNLLSIGEAASTLGVSVDTMRRWDAVGKLIPVRLPSGHRRYRREDIDALIEAGAA